MNATHLHLITNHMPILGFALSAIALIWGMYTKSRNTLLLAFTLIFISAVGGFIAGNTGEAAEEAVENIIGISHDAIHEHEEAAEAAMPFVIASGVLSLFSGFLLIKNHKFSGIAQWVLLLTIFTASSLSARAGLLGGKIRHAQELNAAPVDHQEPEHDDDK